MTANMTCPESIEVTNTNMFLKHCKFSNFHEGALLLETAPCSGEMPLDVCRHGTGGLPICRIRVFADFGLRPPRPSMIMKTINIPII